MSARSLSDPITVGGEYFLTPMFSFFVQFELHSGPELSKDLYNLAADWEWKEPEVKEAKQENSGKSKEGRKEGGDWGEVKKLPPWMWQDTQTSERFRATGDFFKIGNDNFIRQQL